jgi:hypothetical protein
VNRKMKMQRLKIVEWRTGPKSPAGECEPALVRDLETEEIVSKIVGATATPRFTTAPVALGSNTDVLPEFGRWQDVQYHFGIKRGTLYALLAEGKIKSISMRRKGNKHGCRLFYLPGISEYLHSLLEAQTKHGS